MNKETVTIVELTDTQRQAITAGQLARYASRHLHVFHRQQRQVADRSRHVEDIGRGEQEDEGEFWKDTMKTRIYLKIGRTKRGTPKVEATMKQKDANYAILLRRNDRRMVIPTVCVALDIEVDDSHFDISHTVLLLKVPPVAKAVGGIKGEVVTI